MLNTTKIFSLRSLVLAAIAAISICFGSANDAVADIYQTSFDAPDFTAAPLNGQDGWVAQAQWVADGTGNVSNNSGAFVRAHNAGVLGTTDIGETMRIVTEFTLGAYSTPSTDIQAFEEGVFVQGMSHQEGNAAFTYGLAHGLNYSVSSDELQLRANQGTVTGGTSTVTIGAASGLGGTSWSMQSLFTKTAADTWEVSSLLTDTGGGLGTFSLSYTASAGTDLDTDSDGGGIIGGFQALPSGGGSGGVATAPFGATTVSAFAIAVPEPGSAAGLGLAVVALLIKRRRG